MAIRIKLGDYRTVQDDPLGRAYVGYFPRMTVEEAWVAGRGVWKMNRERAGRERFAVVVGGGAVRVVAEITGLEVHADRIALLGHPVADDHPLHERYVGQPDPVDSGSQNPIAYTDLDGEDAFRLRPCSCGCGEDTDRDFRPGHDVRAIQARVREHFGGSALAFVTWVDHQLAASRNAA